MKKCLITILSLILLVSIFTSCAADPSEEELRNRFASYPPDNNVVGVIRPSIFYFADHELDLNNIVNEGEADNDYLFIDGKLYFSAIKEINSHNYSLYVYSCDLYGNNKQLLLEKHGYKTPPHMEGNNGKMYFQHYTTNVFDASARVIDSYDVITGAYQTEVTGKEYELLDYQKKPQGMYSCTHEGDILRVLDEEKNVTYTIEPEALLYSTFNKELEGIELEYSGFCATDNGKMFLLYRSASWPPYPHLVCEYIPETNEIIFSLLYFPYDLTGFFVEYLS